MAEEHQIIMSLKDGINTGIMECSVDDWTGIAYRIHRSKIKDVGIGLKQINYAGIYILLGNDKDTGELKAYIGQTDNIYTRLKQHNRSKDFWDEVVFFVDKANDLDAGHLNYIESKLIRLAKDCDRVALENDTVPKKYDRNFLGEKFVEKITLVMTVLRYDIFEKVLAENEIKPEDIYYIDSVGLKATGAQTSEGFIVFKGSRSSREFKKASSQYLRNKWEELRIKKIVSKDNLFVKDEFFKSPSTAAAMVLGRNTNGLTMWKNKDGKRLKDVMNENI